MPPDRAKRFPGTPKFSPLELLSKELPEHPLFRKNIANRIWWMMMGRGLVEPLDLHHSGNPSSHPELLTLLGAEVAAREYDLRWLIREIALSEAYQLASVLSQEANEDTADSTYQVALEKPMSAEQLLASMLQSVGDGKPVTLDEKAEQLVDLRARFAAAFANPPREPEIGHNPTVKAALFLLNDDVLLSLLKPADGNLVERLAKLEDATQLAEELYMSVLTRRPTPEETEEVSDYLVSTPDDRPTSCGHLVWALLASTEFGVNH